MDDLSNYEIERFSRQLILPNFGKNGQKNLKSQSVLIIGCGGLGCPAALYLAVSGIGKLGLVDDDNIDITNLHRQIAYNENNIGERKAKALEAECKLKNKLLICDVYDTTLEKNNALSIIEKYDVILDCTDNVITRYLINDCCVISGRPLVSGSALRYDGQLTVYNYKNGPCLRCVYPTPPPRETVNNCSDAGILGPLVGVIGTLQAIEAIKILTNIGDCLNGRLLIFNSLDFVTKVFSLRKPKMDCPFCNKSVKSIDSYDYIKFCGSSYNDKAEILNILDRSSRVTCEEYKELMTNGLNHLLLDVRTQNEFSICALPNSTNIEMEKLQYDNNIFEFIGELLKEKKADSIFIVCRRGNDSQSVVNILKENLNNKNIKIKDIIGGLHEWHNSIDKNFPKF